LKILIQLTNGRTETKILGVIWLELLGLEVAKQLFAVSTPMFWTSSDQNFHPSFDLELDLRQNKSSCCTMHHFSFVRSSFDFKMHCFIIFESFFVSSKNKFA
jgi:hypothetical protein